MRRRGWRIVRLAAVKPRVKDGECGWHFMNKMQKVTPAFNAVDINLMSFAKHLKDGCLHFEVNRRAHRKTCPSVIFVPGGGTGRFGKIGRIIVDCCRPPRPVKCRALCGKISIYESLYG